MIADGRHLMNSERRVFSQNGEDGVIEEIFRRVGTTNCFFVEIGCGSGTENNTRLLLEDRGWSGLWVDAVSTNVEEARCLNRGRSVRIREEWVTRDNVPNVFESEHVPSDFDLLVIDIDGNDYWVWQALSAYRPRVVVIEYNAAYLPGRRWIMPYNPHHRFDGTRHYGASLDALVELGERLGYWLVGCESVGINAFFVRRELVGEKFIKGGARVHYSCPKHKALFFGHPAGKGPWLECGPGWRTGDSFLCELASREGLKGQ
jgi:hypothetical protein